MATLVELQVALAAARQKQVEVEGAAFTLRLPSAHAWREAFERHRDIDGRWMQGIGMRWLLDRAVVGWANVTTHTLAPRLGGEASPLAFSDEMRTLLLDTRQDLADLLAIELAQFKREWETQYEAEAKN